MRFSEIWKTALKSIRKNKRRSFLTMIGLVIGISSVITIFSIGRGFERFASEFIGLDDFESKVAFQFTPTDASFYDSDLESFSPDDLQRIESINGVKKVEFYDNAYQGHKYYSIIVEEAKSASQEGNFKLATNKGDPVFAGRSLNEADNTNQNNVVVVNKSIAKGLNKEYPEAAVGKSITINGQLFEVVGVMADRNSNGIVSTPNDFVVGQIPEKSYLNYFNDDSQTLMVHFTENADMTQVTDEIQDTMDKYGSMKDKGSYSSQNLADQVNQIRVILTGITLLVSVIGGISLFISGIGVMNMIYISVSERTKEIGVRRAMGGTKNNIMMQFLLEGITLTLFGGIIGYLFGMGIAFLISMITPFQVTPDLFTVMLALMLSIAIGIIFSWLPAKSAAKKDIVTLLR